MAARFQRRGLWLLPLVTAWICFPLMPGPAAAASDTVPELTGNGTLGETVSNDGKIVLEFSKGEEEVIELEQSRNPDFTDPVVRYRGPQQASVLTGLAEGDYYFRIRTVREDGTSAWSDPVHLRVEYMDRRQLVVLLVTGFAMVAATAVAVIHGGVRNFKSESAAS